MKVTLTVGDRELHFVASGATPLIYKRRTGRGFFNDFQGGFRADNTCDEEAIYNLIFGHLAPEDAKGYADALAWAESFDEFPFLDIYTKLMPLFQLNLKMEKNSTAAAEEVDA